MMQSYYVAIAVIVIIIIVLLLLFFAGGCCGSNEQLVKCLRACRFAAEAKSNQISLGPCCAAQLTNSVGQKTVYTIPDPGSATANFLLDTAPASATPSVNGNALVLSSRTAVAQPNTGGAGNLSAVTVAGPSGVITTQPSGVLTPGTGFAFVVDDTSVLANSVVLLSVQGFTAATTYMPVVSASAVAAGTFTVNVRNAGAANSTSAPIEIGFLIA